MDTKQPEALRLAEMLERPGYGWNSTIEQYAAELRRLHAENETLRKTDAAARGTPAADAPTTAAALSRACDLLSSTIGILMGQRAKIAYTDNSPIAALVNEAAEFLRPWPEQLPSSASAPVVLPEPVAAQSRFADAPSDTWDSCSVEHARSFGGVGYEVRYLYTEQQVRALLATGGQAQAVRPRNSDEAFLAFWEPYELSDHWFTELYKIARDAWNAALAAHQAQADARDATWLTTKGRAHGFRVMQDIPGAVITHSTDSLSAAIAAAKGEQQ